MVNVHGAVEVWCEFTQQWVPGFEVDDSTETFRVRRISDGAPLTEVDPDQVRPTTLTRS